MHVCIVQNVCIHSCTNVRTFVCELRHVAFLPGYLKKLCHLFFVQIVCRSHNVLTTSTKDKISNFCHVAPDKVICVQDCSTIYEVPLLLERQGVLEFLLKRLKLKAPPRGSSSPPLMAKWRNLSQRCVQCLAYSTCMCIYIHMHIFIIVLIECWCMLVGRTNVHTYTL
jgi:hypothetical protein